MKILYGTSNEAKLAYMRFMLKDLPIEILGLNDVDLETVDVIQDGKTPLENATKKAKAYYNAFSMPVFACDSGLFLDGYRLDMQPEVNIRCRNGRRLSDDEMILYYSGLAQNNGGEILAWYENAICLMKNCDECFAHQGTDIASERFIISEKPSPVRREGFPIESLSKHVGTGQYFLEEEILETNTFKVDQEMAKGFRQFFVRHLGLAV